MKYHIYLCCLFIPICYLGQTPQGSDSRALEVNELLKDNTGIDLMNISSRLDTLNGQVNFEPSPEGGTLATINIPLYND